MAGTTLSCGCGGGGGGRGLLAHILEGQEAESRILMLSWLFCFYSVQDCGPCREVLTTPRVGLSPSLHRHPQRCASQMPQVLLHQPDNHSQQLQEAADPDPESPGNWQTSSFVCGKCSGRRLVCRWKSWAWGGRDPSGRWTVPSNRLGAQWNKKQWDALWCTIHPDF